MSNLTYYIKLDDVINASRQILENINPEVYLFTKNGEKEHTNFIDLSNIAQLNKTFDGLLATGYNVLTSNNRELIKFNFENNIKHDFKYYQNYRNANYNPINELVNELQEININFDEFLNIIENKRI